MRGPTACLQYYVTATLGCFLKGTKSEVNQDNWKLHEQCWLAHMLGQGWSKPVVLQVVSHLDRRITNITQERWLFFAAFRSLVHPWSGHLSELNGAETRIRQPSRSRDRTMRPERHGANWEDVLTKLDTRRPIGYGASRCRASCLWQMSACSASHHLESGVHPGSG